jgi:hypothetical protein
MMTSTQTPGSTGYATPTKSESRGRPFTIAGLVCGLISIFLIPIVLGPLGIIFGFVGYSRGDRKGLWVGIGSIVCMAIGLALGYLILSSRH